MLCMDIFISRTQPEFVTSGTIYVNYYCHKLPHQIYIGAWRHLIFNNGNLKLNTKFIEENEEGYSKTIL